MKFGIIGNGRIAQMHEKAIASIGGKVCAVYDPDVCMINCSDLEESFFSANYLDYAVICSPTYCHYEHIRTALRYGCKVIVEKPMVLPWEPILDNDDISVVLQLRWIPLKGEVNQIYVRAVRHDPYFTGWRSDPKNTGGVFFEIFIHYIDLALFYGAEFVGVVSQTGNQARRIDDLDLFSIDNDQLYASMYHDIVFGPGGVHPKDIAKLHWSLSKFTGRFGGPTRDLFDQVIRISPEDLI